MKPMLASDYDEDKIVYPVIVQPKIDGVRALVIDGRLVGRSLKSHRNIFTTSRFSIPEFDGLDGEMIVGPNPTASDLCRKTSSALSTIQGEPDIYWFVFDWITERTKNMVYLDRYAELCDRVKKLRAVSASDPFHPAHKLIVMPTGIISTKSAFLEVDEYNLECGYEGTILRRMNGKHKQGRSTVREGGLLRVKRFVEEEAVVLSIAEGSTNTNKPQVNELGQQYRTSHQENMVPNGMVGSLLCRNLKDGATITVSHGRMTEAERVHYFQNQSELVGKTIKYKHFPVGVKDKPRFPTFQTIRIDSDMGDSK